MDTMTTTLATIHPHPLYIPAQEIQTRQPDQNPAAVYIASLESAHSRRTMQSALTEIAAMLTGSRTPFDVAWNALRFQHTAAIRSKLAETYAAATANKMLCALRGTLKAARDLGQMSAEDYSRAATIKAIKGETLPRGRALSRGEIGALLTSCTNDPTPAGARDAAIIALLYGCGLRRAEAAALELDAYDASAAQLRVMGKRNKERSTPITQGAAAAVEDWLTIRGTATGALFHPITKGGSIEPRHMHAQAIYDMLTKRAQAAGIKNLSPHDFRRTFVSDLLDAGADIGTVQHLAGHASVQTTIRYDRRGEAAKRKAVDLLHVPYTPRATLPTSPN